ncbi:MAG: TetR/AcrR family transcriptional regulator [Burkholderiaceae bacterium]|jgi:AcrR family transcriptional regulator|nr:TetR/AcrR family transcriptional regulator [Burkholderiales bacterium]TAL66225.1 MAG: TetR/AcrR family transcriptional regulator [Burkholderiaceae bacterium]TBR74903.1 MAG: TetR/AcrR family transcriptional regulator [Burkholderiaceae bacterium]
MKPKDDEKQRAIAQATFRLVAESGLAALTMSDIARAANIATATLYVYYPSKDELLVQLYEQAKTATAHRLMHAYDARAPLRARARAVWLAMLHNRLAHFAEASFQEQFAASPWFRERSQRMVASAMGAFSEALDEGRRHEVLKNVPVALLAANFIASVREAARLIRGGELPDDEASRTAAFSMCWDALKA